MSTGSSRNSTRASANWSDAVTFAAGCTSLECGRVALPAPPLVSLDGETGRRTASRFPSQANRATTRYAAFNASRATSAKYRAPTGRISSLKS